MKKHPLSKGTFKIKLWNGDRFILLKQRVTMTTDPRIRPFNRLTLFGTKRNLDTLYVFGKGMRLGTTGEATDALLKEGANVT